MKYSALLILLLVSCQQNDRVADSEVVAELQDNTPNIKSIPNDSTTYTAPIFKDINIVIEVLESTLVEKGFKIGNKTRTDELSVPKLFKTNGFLSFSKTKNMFSVDGRKTMYIVFVYSTEQLAWKSFTSATNSIYLDSVFKAGGIAYLVGNKILYLKGNCSLNNPPWNELPKTFRGQKLLTITCKCGGYCDIVDSYE
jgi:hypothetical protein